MTVARTHRTPHQRLRSRGDPAEFDRDITPDYGGKLTVGGDLMTFEV